MKVAVAHSDDPDIDAAITDLLTTLRDKLEGQAPTGGMLFCSPCFSIGKIANAVCDAFDGIELIGCTTDGEVSSELRFQQDSVTLIVFSSSSLRFRSFMAENVSKNAKESIPQMAQLAIADEKPALCFTVPAGLVVSATVVVEQLSTNMPGVPFLGGVAGDDWNMVETHQVCNRKVVTDGVPLLCIYGDLKYSTGIASGWEPIGEIARVTKSDGPRVYEIDGESAVNFYRKYLGETVPFSPEHPLALHGQTTTFELRAPLLDDDDGSILFVGDVPQDTSVQLTKATREAIVNASRDSIEQALNNYPEHTPDAAILFSCAARKQLLGTATEMEYAMLEDRISGIETCGFYTYGEIGPHHTGGNSMFHNQTFIAVLLGD